MKTSFEHVAYGSSAEQDQAYQEDIQQQRFNNLAAYESGLISEQDEHPWWSFFDAGAEDENGTTWSVYNRWHDETQTWGWKVVHCPEGQTDFHEIPIRKVIRTDVRKAVASKDGLITFQIGIRDEAAGFTNNDVLNVMLYHNGSEVTQPKLKMWNQKSAMRPVVRPSQAAQEVGSSEGQNGLEFAA